MEAKHDAERAQAPARGRRRSLCTPAAARLPSRCPGPPWWLPPCCPGAPWRLPACCPGPPWWLPACCPGPHQRLLAKAGRARRAAVVGWRAASPSAPAKHLEDQIGLDVERWAEGLPRHLYLLPCLVPKHSLHAMGEVPVNHVINGINRPASSPNTACTR